MNFLVLYAVSSALVGTVAWQQGHSGVWYGLVSLLLTPFGGAVSVWYTSARQDYKSGSRDRQDSEKEKTEEVLSRDISYFRDWGRGGGTVSTRSVSTRNEEDLLTECFEEFRHWFDRENVRHRKSDGRKLYFPPVVMFANEEGDAWVGNMMDLGEGTGVDNFEKLLAASYLIGEKASREVRPLAFATVLDGKLVNGSTQKVYVLVSRRSGSKRAAFSTIFGNDGTARLSPSLTSADKDSRTMLYVANAFWVGTGAGALHKAPRVALTYNSVPKDLGTPRYRELGGSVYALVNPALPGVVKIGYTTKDAQVRAKELSEAGVPDEWTVSYEVGTNRPKQVKEEVCSRLSHQKPGGEGQFFKISPGKASRTIRSVTEGHVRITLKG